MIGYATQVSRVAAFSTLLVFALCKASHADVLTGRVVAIVDGDTITVLDEAHMQHKIRLCGIDAPERGQPFGARSKESLSELAFGKLVGAECVKRDRYGRQVCKVVVEGVDIGLAQVQRGMAWWYEKYHAEQTVQDRRAYATAQEDARRSAAGIWSAPSHMPPWEYRKITRKSHFLGPTRRTSD